MTTREAKLTHLETEYSVVDVSDNITTVFDGPCDVYGVYINTVLSAQDLPIKDGTTTVITVAAAATVGTYLVFPGVRFDTSLIVDPDDVATGNVTVMFRKINPA